jgi:hypothetical protein
MRKTTDPVVLAFTDYGGNLQTRGRIHTCPGGPGEDWRKIEQMFVREPGPKNRLPTIFRSGPGDVRNFGEKSHRVTGAKISRLLLTPQMG